MKTVSSIRSQVGSGTIESLVAILVLSVGVMAVAGFQANFVSQGTDSQNRLLASRLVDEHLNMALADSVNAVCYTWENNSVSASCGVASKKSATEAWRNRVATLLPSGDPIVRFNSATGRLQAQVRWTVKRKDGVQTTPSTAGHDYLTVFDHSTVPQGWSYYQVETNVRL